MYARLRALTLVAVVVAVPLQQVVPAVAPASTVGPCASIAIGITDDWCTDTCTQGDGSYCNTASCVCGEEAKAELAKPDRAIDAAPVGAPAPTAVPVSSRRAVHVEPSSSMVNELVLMRMGAVRATSGSIILEQEL